MGRGRAQGKHAGLNRGQVLQAALTLIDREGAAALSMRRVANELGVEAMTLYHHVRSKEALEDAIVEYVLAASMQDSRQAVSWQQAVTGYAYDLHRGLLAHPGTVSLIATRPALTAQNVRVLESLLKTLTEAGFAPATALHIVHATAVAVIGQHVTENENIQDSALEAGEDVPLVRQALDSGPLDLETRLKLMLTALTIGYESLCAGADHGPQSAVPGTRDRVSKP